jgi:phasin family protein
MPKTKGRTTAPGKASRGKALKPRPKKGATAGRAPGAARAGARAKAATPPKGPAKAKAEGKAMTPPTAPRVRAVKKAALAGYEDFAELGAGNIEAVFDSGKIFAEGMETLGEEMATYARDSFEGGMEVARGLGECKSLTEALDRQSAFARSSFDKFVAEAAKLSDMSAKVARDSLEPINARVNATAERFIKTVTA